MKDGLIVQAYRVLEAPTAESLLTYSKGQMVVVTDKKQAQCEREASFVL
jgi:hypothetical protein